MRNEGIDLDAWPDCIVPGCRNKCCLRLNSDKCYPHTIGTEPSQAVYSLINQIEAMEPEVAACTAPSAETS